MDKHMPCVEALKQGMSDSYAMQYRAHAYHWNVEGPDFQEMHAFFAMIQDDVYESIDKWAENIRTMNAMAPQSLAEVGMPSTIEDVMVGSDPMEMCIALYEANEVCIASVNEAFRVASEMNEQGIANFLADRDAAHKKWRWQLNAITGIGNKAVEPMPEPMVEEEMLPMVDYEDEYLPEDYDESMIYFGSQAEKMLNERIKSHNHMAAASLQASGATVRAVYRRGAHEAGDQNDRHSVGLARVDAYLRLLRVGKPAKSSYKKDNDLLPESHQLSTRANSALIAAGEVARTVDFIDFSKPESAILAATEYSGLGYGAESAFRASWIRATNNNEDPGSRIFDLAKRTYDSKDADLLPVR